ncbi:hypothetical protein Cob_v009690 [Colletotrichum orbiculare MAFF 240422]|uniref:Uncharacterized protein n=1 Tax=Colletotrichum orbiculare (strain 104-T / ATCC 96160 / CBS 514.97 / LARS 414 / MAFF 240422) TaxID=1213857 RepID=A0A484FIJ4_COLOR|nr:hypothetical protein Cob_v009690 [Colletotrichum orbiculare MAFF 240422]
MTSAPHCHLDVIVRGGLYLGPNTKVDFYTSAYWSEAASETVTKHATSSSGSSGLAKNVAVSQRLNSASTCVGSNGYVGILNVNFRIVSQGGSRVVFGKERDSSPVTESLGLTSLSC